MIDQFYKDYQSEIIKTIKENDDIIAFYRIMFIKNINKTGLYYERALLADAIVDTLEAKNKGLRNDLERIASRNKTTPTLVKWYRTTL